MDHFFEFIPFKSIGVHIVWRSFFFAIGAMLIIVGVECLLIDSATLAGQEVPQTMQVSNGWFQAETLQVNGKREVRPPEWIPWSLIATGAITVLYALTLPARWGQSD